MDALARADDTAREAISPPATRLQHVPVAWCNGTPVATSEVRWQGHAAPEVNERFSICPELNGLSVWPPELRSPGTTSLIRVDS